MVLTKLSVVAGCVLSLVGGIALSQVCEGTATPLRPGVPLSFAGPQGIALDTTDGTLWINSAISPLLLHLSPELEVLGTIPSPFAALGLNETGGVTYRAETDTLLVCHTTRLEVREVTREGIATDLVIPLQIPPNELPGRPAFLQGLLYDPTGDGGRGSLWVVDSSETSIHELDLSGQPLQKFCAPDDPDGCPGQGTAAQTSCIGFVGGVPGGDLEVTGGRRHRDLLLRVDRDGTFHGETISLGEAGGTIGGFLRVPLDALPAPARARARARAALPVEATPETILLATLQSSAQLQVLVDTPPRIVPIERLVGEIQLNRSVLLKWAIYAPYERIEIRREGELLGSLSGAATSYLDENPPAEGQVDYEVSGILGACSTSSRTTVVLGVGEILRSVVLPGSGGIDLAEDGSGNLWVTTYDGTIQIFDKDLERQLELTGPYMDPGEALGGIAYHPGRDAMIVLGSYTQRYVLVNQLGEVVDGPHPTGLPTDLQPPASVSAAAFDPAARGGLGALWLLDRNRGRIEQRGLDGSLLDFCLHPDHAAEGLPERFRSQTIIFGLCERPGSGFTRFLVSGGRPHEDNSNRIFAMTSTCQEEEEEIPGIAIDLSGAGFSLGLLRTTHRGVDTLYVVDSAIGRSRLLSLDPRVRTVAAVRHLSARQESPAREVTLRFIPPSDADGIEVRRDGLLIDRLPGTVRTHVDRDAPPGSRVYDVRATRGGLVSDGRETEVLVGSGSISQAVSAAGFGLSSGMVMDPEDGSYIASSGIFSVGDDLHVFNSDLTFRRKFPAPFPFPLRVAALALRLTGGERELYCLGWEPGSGPRGNRELPLRVLDLEGRILRELTVIPPSPGELVTYPAGLVWDSLDDTFWLVERNAVALVHLDSEGLTLEELPLPSQPLQDDVQNVGIALDPRRGVLYLPTAGKLEHDYVTRWVESTRRGQLTGEEVIYDGRYVGAGGFCLSADGTEIVTAARTAGAWDMLSFRIAALPTAVLDLSCELGPAGVDLTWSVADGLERIEVYRGLELAATLPASALSWHEDVVPGSVPFYRVVGAVGEDRGPGAVCNVVSRAFSRGDVERNDVVNITDAVAILSYLFLGTGKLDCLDAADVDDNGDVDISDAVRILSFLFLSGSPPALPYPEPGSDPSPDALGCERATLVGGAGR